MRDLRLRDRVGRQADGVGVAFGFQELLDLGLGEGGIASEVAAQHVTDFGWRRSRILGA